MNALYRLLTRLRVLLLFFALEVVALWLLANSSYYQHATIVSAIRTAGVKVDAQLDTWEYYFSLRETNERLSQENNSLRNRLERCESILSDSLKINVFSDTLGRPLFDYIQATVVTNSVNDLHNYITLNVGSDKGIQPDMGVIVHNGLVGTVVTVFDHYSLVKSLLNVNTKVSAKLAANGAFGSLFWDGKNYREALLTEIPQHINVNIGDTIVSSGYSAIFPSDIPIGTVKSFTIKRGNFYEIVVTLFADFKQIRYVDVVEHLYAKELKALESSKKKHE